MADASNAGSAKAKLDIPILTDEDSVSFHISRNQENFHKQKPREKHEHCFSRVLL